MKAAASLVLIVVATLGVACSSGRPSQSEPPRAEPPLLTARDSGRRAAQVRADNAARRADTLIVQPAEIRVRAGDSVSIRRMAGVWALDTTGAEIPYFAPLFLVRPSPAARFRGGYLIGLTPGEAVLEVRGSQFPPPKTLPARPLTLVPIRIVP